MSGLTILDHPLVLVRLSTLRAKTTAPAEFRGALQEVATFLLFEAAKSWELAPREIQTPLTNCSGAQLAQRLALVPILRAGLGLLDGIWPLGPEAAVGHIGLYRDPETLRPVSYYTRFPSDLAGSQVLLLDPMLATGHSACAAAAMLKADGAKRIQLVCVLACPEGVAQVRQEHPDLSIITAALDPGLNEYGYIVPGLGDAGDRYFGTT